MDDALGYLTRQGNEILAGFLEALPAICAALILLFVVWIVTRIGGRIITQIGKRMHLRTNLIEVLTLLFSTTIWLFGGLIALTLVFPTITPGKALTTLGLGSVAIGFAFKDTFENFLAGILILLREPFEINDYIECEDVEGQIEKITIRDTHIRQTDGQLVVVPNNLLFQNPVTVRTSRDLRRITVICGVGYGENVDESREVIEKAVRAVDSVRDDVKDVQIFAQAFGSSSIDFEVTWWTGSLPIDVRKSKDQVIASIKAALDDAGVEIPFPYRTLTVSEPIPVKAITDD